MCENKDIVPAIKDHPNKINKKMKSSFILFYFKSSSIITEHLTGNRKKNKKTHCLETYSIIDL